MFDADFVRMFTTDEVSKDVVRVVMESILDGSKLAPYPYVSSMKNYGIDNMDGAVTSRPMTITRMAILNAAKHGETSVRVHVTMKYPDVYIGILKDRGFSVKAEGLGNYTIKWG